MKKTANLLCILGAIFGLFSILTVLFTPAKSADLQTVNIGSSANDGTGDTIRSAFVKVNTNFWDLWATRVIEINSNTGTNITVDASEVPATATTKFSGTNVQEILESIDSLTTTTNTANRVLISDSSGVTTSTNDLTFDGDTFAITANKTIVGTSSGSSNFEVHYTGADAYAVRIDGNADDDKARIAFISPDVNTGVWDLQLISEGTSGTTGGRFSFNYGGSPKFQVTPDNTEIRTLGTLFNMQGDESAVFNLDSRAGNFPSTPGSDVDGDEPVELRHAIALRDSGSTTRRQYWSVEGKKTLGTTLDLSRLSYSLRYTDDATQRARVDFTPPFSGDSPQTAEINLQTADDWILSTDASQDLYIQTNGGNLAIGKTSASERLDVSGTAAIDSSSAQVLKLSRNGGSNNNTLIEFEGASSQTTVMGLDADGDYVMDFDTANPNSDPDLRLNRDGTLYLKNLAASSVNSVVTENAGVLESRTVNQGAWSTKTPDRLIFSDASGYFAVDTDLQYDGDKNLQLGSQGDLRFADGDSSNWIGFQAPSTVATNVTFTLPQNTGTGGQILSSNSAGTLSWTDKFAPTTGTWTPTLEFGGGTAGITYDIREGHYVYDGVQCTVYFHIDLSSKGSASGNASISGVPYTAKDVSGLLSVGKINATGMASTMDDPTINARDNQAELDILDVSVKMTDADFNNGSVIYGSVTYIVE